jgi:hypothetical protein
MSAPRGPKRHLTYSRRARLLKQRMAALFAPTVAEGLTDSEVQKRLGISKTGRLLMAGAVGLSADHTQRRASAAGTASPRPRKQVRDGR